VGADRVRADRIGVATRARLREKPR
jgi:hypothetical protein